MSSCIRIGNISPSANGISHCEYGEQKHPKTSPSLCTMWTPCNTPMPPPTGRTTPNGSSDGWGTVAHVRREVAIGYNGASEIRPQKFPFPWTDPQTPIPATSLDPSDLWCQCQTRATRPNNNNNNNNPICNATGASLTDPEARRTLYTTSQVGLIARSNV